MLEDRTVIFFNFPFLYASIAASRVEAIILSFSAKRSLREFVEIADSADFCSQRHQMIAVFQKFFQEPCIFDICPYESVVFVIIVIFF